MLIYCTRRQEYTYTAGIIGIMLATLAMLALC